MKVRPFGDSAVLIELEQRIEAGLVARARAIAGAWALGPAVPAYASVVAHFDPLAVTPDEALARAGALSDVKAKDASAGRLIEVPTVYDGPDLEEVALLSGISTDQVVAMHAAIEYTAFFLGFMPGFAYCGTLDPRIVAPRLDSPRARVPAGSVAIADGQTAVYPFDSPGGWRLIGRTALRPFAADREPPALIRPGDRLRFVRA